MTAALRAEAGGDVQYGGVPGAGAGEHRQMMGPGEDVDGVDLQQPGAGQGALEGEPAGAGAGGAAAARRPYPLGAQGDTPCLRPAEGGGMVCSFAAPADMTTGGVPDQHSPPVVAPGSARGRLLLEFDHAVVPALTAVDDLGIARLGVDEQEEDVTDHLHPVERIVDGHRRSEEHT